MTTEAKYIGQHGIFAEYEVEENGGGNDDRAAMTDTEKINAIADCTREAVEVSEREYESPEEKREAYKAVIERKEQLVEKLKEEAK